MMKMINLAASMGCRKLEYHQGEVLERSALFIEKSVEKKVCESKKRISEYTYGFNGMERDDELKGSGNSYDFGARIFDPRIARWMSLDPLQAKFPSLSPYNFVANSPLQFVDPDGRDIKYSTKTHEDGSKTVFVTVNAKMINLSSKNIHTSSMTAIKSNIESKARSTFSQTTTDPAGNEMKVVFNINIEVVDDVNDIGANDHVIGIVDDIPKRDGKETVGLAQMGGNIATIEAGRATTDQLQDAIHEIGHNLGLDHEGDTPANKNNLMKENGSTGYEVTPLQTKNTFYQYSAKGSGTQRNANNESGNSKTELKEFIKDNNIKTK